MWKKTAKLPSQQCNLPFTCFIGTMQKQRSLSLHYKRFDDSSYQHTLKAKSLQTDKQLTMGGLIMINLIGYTGNVHTQLIL